MLDESVQVGEFRQDLPLPGVVFLDDPVALENLAQDHGGALRPLQLLLAGPLQPGGRADLLLLQRVALFDLRLNRLDRFSAADEELDRLAWIGQLNWHGVLQFWLGATGLRQCPPRFYRVARTDSLSVTASARTNRIIRQGGLCDEGRDRFMRAIPEGRNKT